MQNKEVKEALKSMRIFARVHQDMATVSAQEMEIVLQYIDQLENKVKELKKENTEMQVEIAEQVYFESMPLDQMRELQTKANKYDSLVEKVKELGKGQHTLMQSRRKWKNRYYKEKRKNVK